MESLEKDRYKISEVSRITNVPTYVLRQWEERFDTLKPKRDRAGRRYYTPDDIRLVQQIRKLLWQDKLKSEGVNKLLKRGQHHIDQFDVKNVVLELADEIEQQVRELIDLLDAE